MHLPPPPRSPPPLPNSGATALHFGAAAKRNAAAVCDALLAAGADPSAVDRAGCLPYERVADDANLRKRLGGPDPRLFELAAAGDAAELKRLVLAGDITNVRALDADGRHALCLAAEAGDAGLPALELLLEVDPGLAPLPDMTGACALHAAAEAGAARAVEALLRVLTREQVNQRSMHLSEYSQGDWTSKSDGAIVAPWDKTALLVAVEAGDADVARLLLAAGADPNIPDYDGGNALHAAAAAQEEGMVEMLLAAGAE